MRNRNQLVSGAWTPTSVVSSLWTADLQDARAHIRIPAKNRQSDAVPCLQATLLQIVTRCDGTVVRFGSGRLNGECNRRAMPDPVNSRASHLQDAWDGKLPWTGGHPTGV